MQGVRWSDDDLKAHQERMRAQVVPLRPAPVPGPAAQRTRSPLKGDCGVRARPADTSSPKSGKRKYPEQDQQILAIEILDVALPPQWRVVHVGNGVHGGGKQAKIANAIRKAMGVREGFPDLLFVGPGGRSVLAEGKFGNRALTDSQEEWRDWCLANGVPWFVWRSIDDLLAGCADAGIPLRVRA